MQNQLHLMGLYEPYDTDGRFGPMTRAARIAAVDLVACRGDNDMSHDLTEPEQARAFLDDMAMGRFMSLHDDGYEG
ncbi:MAG: hypothetical protein GVY34_07000 [Alphaproteobacteria bacterium]|nr:hypothetical protein [Alphaproteobacteria bacterium]